MGGCCKTSIRSCLDEKNTAEIDKLYSAVEDSTADKEDLNQSSASKEKEIDYDDSLANNLMSISFYQEMLNNNKLEITMKDKMKEYSNLSLAKVFEKIYETIKFQPDKGLVNVREVIELVKINFEKSLFEINLTLTNKTPNQTSITPPLMSAIIYITEIYHYLRFENYHFQPRKGEFSVYSICYWGPTTNIKRIIKTKVYLIVEDLVKIKVNSK